MFFLITRTYFLTVGKNNFPNKIPRNKKPSQIWTEPLIWLGYDTKKNNYSFKMKANN